MTLADATATLTKIATFEIPVVRIKRGEYVAVGHVRYLRELARVALGLPRAIPADRTELTEP